MPVGDVDGRPTAIGAAGRRALLTPRGLAEYLSLSERTVRELLRTGELPSYKVAVLVESTPMMLIPGSRGVDVIGERGEQAAARAPGAAREPLGEGCLVRALHGRSGAAPECGHVPDQA
jgi:hypothetical protein